MFSGFEALEEVLCFLTLEGSLPCKGSSVKKSAPVVTSLIGVWVWALLVTIHARTKQHSACLQPGPLCQTRAKSLAVQLRVKNISWQKVVHGSAVYGTAKFQALKFAFQGLKLPVKSLGLLVRSRNPLKFQPLKFQNSGPGIWRIHTPPFHTPPFACLE